MYCIKLDVLHQTWCTASNMMYCFKLDVMHQTWWTASNLIFCIKFNVLHQTWCTASNLMYCIKLDVLHQTWCTASNLMYCIQHNILHQTWCTASNMMYCIKHDVLHHEHILHGHDVTHAWLLCCFKLSLSRVPFLGLKPPSYVGGISAACRDCFFPHLVPTLWATWLTGNREFPPHRLRSDPDLNLRPPWQESGPLPFAPSALAQCDSYLCVNHFHPLEERI